MERINYSDLEWLCHHLDKESLAWRAAMELREYRAIEPAQPSVLLQIAAKIVAGCRASEDADSYYASRDKLIETAIADAKALIEAIHQEEE